MSSKEITGELALKKAVAAMAMGRVGEMQQTGDPWGEEVGVLKAARGEPILGCISWPFQNKNNEHEGEARFIGTTAEKSDS